MKKIFSLIFLGISLNYITNAQLRLPAIMSSGMVLQQNDSVTLWGWANPGEKVFVKTGWNNRTDTTITTNNATFRLKVKTPPAGGPFNIIFRSIKTIELTDVLIGEVWLCSGQSNMEWNYYYGLPDIKAELPICYNSRIRFFHIPKTGAEYPQEDVKAQWAICDSNTLKSFSGVGYFFGKKLNKDLDVPIGLINASWGGTPAEPWTPQEEVNKDEELRIAAAHLSSARWWPIVPGNSYNGMIHPVTPFNIAGVIWYQGESNVITNNTYQKLFTTMIDSWRKKWDKMLPFYYVQIAPYKYRNHNTGALLQEVQTKVMSHPRTGMVVITDLVDTVTDIHPRNKHDVGYRLANWALAENYHRTGLHYKSPVFASKEIKKDRIILSFHDVPNGFNEIKNASGFYISGEKEEWLPAKVRIEKDKIIVWNEKLSAPLHVRYGFGNTIIGNVSTREGLPLTPFRTDGFGVDQSPIQ